jgi:hypothetical protein
MPSREDAPAPLDGYIISFVPFHERGFMMPPHPFLRRLLHHYQIELQHLNPTGIQHIAAFIMLCEGYLGIERHFDLWEYFFTVSLLNKKKNRMTTLVVMGCASIHLRSNRQSPIGGGIRFGSM